MERAMLVMGLMVAIVAVVGIFSKVDFNVNLGEGITGNVISQTNANVVSSEKTFDCNSCIGYRPVCATRNHKAKSYDNECEAVCDNSKVIYHDFCENIPRAN